MAGPAARPRWGQHFLQDVSVAERIVAALDCDPEIHLPVEIGPGKGALTLPLLQRFGHLHAVEKDADLVRSLVARLPVDPGISPGVSPGIDQGVDPGVDQNIGQGLHLHLADALHFDFQALAARAARGKQLWLIGNLPYEISTPLLFHLLRQRSCITGMLFMLQREVAQRIAAPAGGANYGRLSVMVQYWCETENLFEVPAHAFAPPPRVTSQVLCLRLRAAPRVAARDLSLFASLVQQAFSQRRKTLRNALRGLAAEPHFETAQLSACARPQTLSAEDFARLANAIEECRPAMSPAGGAHASAAKQGLEAGPAKD